MANSKNGKIFIAYRGTSVTQNEIERELRKDCSSGYTVKTKNVDNTIFSKVVYNQYIEDRDPCLIESVMTVNGFNQEEMEALDSNFYDYSNRDDDRKHFIINNMYRTFDTSFLKMIESHIHLSTVIYDKNKKTLIGAFTSPNGSYTNLYYGHTLDNEIMFSNNYETLSAFCNDVKKMEPNTYLKDDVIYDFENKEVKRLSKNLIPKSKENADSLIDGLNLILLQITKSSVKEKIESDIEDYLSSDDPKKKLEDFINNELDNETKKEVLKLIKDIIEKYNLENGITEKLNQIFDEKLDEYSKTNIVPVKHIITLNDVKKGEAEGFFHERFEQILRQVQLDEPVMLIGPAGSGKNVAVAQVAKALGHHMYYTNNASNEFKLTGFIDAGGTYRDTEFYKAFKNGGVFFLDEIDNSDPSALIVINSALANGYMAFPHETIDRHPDFRIVAAANTWGKGADLAYVGRNALDAATLDRFDNIFFDYDEKLEESLYPNEEILKFMWAFRNSVYKNKIPHIVSTRGIGKVYKKELNNVPVEDILTSNVVKNLGIDDVNTIVGSMTDINDSNKFFKKIKTLNLSKKGSR